MNIFSAVFAIDLFAHEGRGATDLGTQFNNMPALGASKLRTFEEL